MEINAKKTAPVYKVVERFVDWNGRQITSQPMAVFESKEQAGDFLMAKGYSPDHDGAYVIPRPGLSLDSYQTPFATIEECSSREADLILEANKIALERSKVVRSYESPAPYETGGIEARQPDEPLIIKVKEVTLPSMEEAKLARDNVPGILEKTDAIFWLRDRGGKADHVMCVDSYGLIYYNGYPIDSSYYIRPLIRMETPDGVSLNAGEKLCIKNREWTVIAPDMALCDDIVACAKFRDVTPDYTGVLAGTDTEPTYIAKDGSAVPEYMLSEFEGSDANVAVDQFAIDEGLIQSFPYIEPEYTPEM